MKKLITRLVLTYLRVCAVIAVRRAHPCIIGITGSVGKTSTRDALFAILKDSHKTYVIKKGNSETGIPLGLLGLTVHSIGFDSLHKSIKDWMRLIVQAPMRTHFLKKYTHVIVEMGIDEPTPPKNMRYLLKIIQPEIAVVLNVYPVHAQQFERVVSAPITQAKILHAIASEKSRIITDNPACRCAIWNTDSLVLHEFLHDIRGPHYTFGTAEDNTLSWKDYSISESHSRFVLTHSREGDIELTFRGFLLPRGFQEVFASALLVGEHLGLSYEDMVASLEKNFTLEPGRSSLLAGVDDTILIDSSYNSSPEAVLTMLELAKSLKDTLNRPLVFVCGDMRELGKQAVSEHTRILEACKKDVDYVYTVGPLSRKHIHEPLVPHSRIKSLAFEGPHDVGRYLKHNLPPKAIVLFKGSQNTLFLEEAIKYVLADSEDSKALARQEDYWMRKKQFDLQTDPLEKIV